MACAHGQKCTCSFLGGGSIEIDDSTGTVYVYRRSGTHIVTHDTPTFAFAQTGGGTDDSPRVISAHAAIAALIDFDPANLAVVVSGAGTEASPLTVSASLTCLQCGEPEGGDVPLMGVDGVYRPHRMPVLAAAQITPGVGILGDGSAPNPLRLDLCTYDELAAACIPPVIIGTAGWRLVASADDLVDDGDAVWSPEFSSGWFLIRATDLDGVNRIAAIQALAPGPITFTGPDWSVTFTQSVVTDVSEGTGTVFRVGPLGVVLPTIVGTPAAPDAVTISNGPLT